MKAFSGSFEDVSTVLTKNKSYFHPFSCFQFKNKWHTMLNSFSPQKAFFLVAQIRMSLMDCCSQIPVCYFCTKELVLSQRILFSNPTFFFIKCSLAILAVHTLYIPFVLFCHPVPEWCFLADLYMLKNCMELVMHTGIEGTRKVWQTSRPRTGDLRKDEMVLNEGYSP